MQRCVIRQEEGVNNKWQRHCCDSVSLYPIVLAAAASAAVTNTTSTHNNDDDGDDDHDDHDRQRF